MPSDKFHSLVGMQDTENAMKHVRLMADERKRLSSLANWKPRGYSVLQVMTAHFFISSALSLCPFTNTFPNQAHLVWFASANTKEGVANGT